MNRIALAVLDMAGTTVADNGSVEEAFVDAMVEIGIRRTDPIMDRHLDVVRQTMGQSKITVFRRLLDDENRARDANAAFEASYARQVDAGQVSPVEGAEATIVALRDAGIQVALTTGFADATRQAILQALGWTDLVDLSLSPGPRRRGRPYPDLVLAATMACDVDDVRSVAVAGDTASDLLAGTRAGATIVAGVLTGAHNRDTLSAAPHTHILDSVTDLLPVIAKSQ